MGTNTGIGIGIGIPFKNNALGGDRPYLPPELKARLIGVWDNYGKKNTDADRNIIKNKIPNAGGDLEILNAAYKLNSGFGEYKEDFTSWRIYLNIEVTDNVITTNGNFNSTWFIYKHANESEINEMNIKVSGIPEGGIIRYFYIPDETATIPVSYNISEDGVYHLPKSKLSSNRISIGFTVSSSYDWNNIRIEQLPDFGGAFVTDGINDMIVSQKTLQEMGVTKGLTIVSMIHQINTNESNFITTNNLRTVDKVVGRNIVSNIDKTGIYGWYKENIEEGNIGVINNILGDKADYIAHNSPNTNTNPITNSKFYVTGYAVENGFIELSSVAYYWTFAVLGKATEDEINLIIGNYNLDRSLKPDILCNIGKQGITNDNHADFNDKLIDYSGNGRDIQMNNLAWKGGSGIAAKQYETFKDWLSETSSTSIITQIDEFTRIVESTTNDYWVSRIRRDSDLDKVYDPINVYLYQDNNFLVHECKYEVDGVKYSIPINEPVGKGYHKLEIYTKDRYTELPENAEKVVLSEWYFSKSNKGSIKYSVIPSHKGGILLDGITDFGKVTGMPIYKDYTFIIDREIISIGNTAGIVASKSEDSKDVNKQGAFLFEYLDAPNNISAWSFYKDNGKVANTDFTRGISYQSKYSYNGIELLAGTALDSDKLWLGILRDRDSRFANVAIYSLMSFPYSMSKFLIERQLKKHKLGTFYPNMVEFRPVINSNIDIKKINYWDKDGNILHIGDYVSVGNAIKTNITVPNGYKVSKVTSDAFDNITIEKSSTDFIYDVKFYGIKKSPQKISITIEQDENYVLFNPVINSNYDNYKLTFHLREYEKLINIGDYIPKGTYIRANLYLKNNIDELATFTFNGMNIDYVKSPVLDTAYNIGQIYNYDSPQEVNITIDEYIRYEEIVQPYPVIFQIKDRNTNQRYSWGDKIKVGSSIQLIHGEKPNILSGLYSIQSYEYEGKTYSYNQLTNLNIILTKQSISLSCNKIWLLDNNEPKSILSPRLLRIPNSSYKILGYIPDISGHGNHGIIHNSAYAEGSGVNEDGSYQLDGVDDFVTIPTIAGKQVLIKLNWQNKAIGNLIYDQRDNDSTTSFAILPISINDTTKNRIAYQERNANGITYIDGIRNEYIESYSLENIIHNITITNPDVSNKTVVLGASNRTTADYFAKYALYDFMLFDEISTDDKIKELNTYIGITPKVTLPNYYWDNYGKKNTDAKRGYIDEQVSLQKTGTSVNPLENFNISYEGMSGYNGYPVVFGANKTWETSNAVDYIYDINSTIVHITNVKHAANGLLYSYVKRDEALANIKEILAFRVTVKGLEGNSKLIYKYLATENATKESIVYLGNGTHKLPKSFVPTDALLDLTTNSWIGFAITPMIEGELVFDCDITIEILPEYENGLAYDGVSDFTDNKNIPIFTDFTAIIKRVDLDAKNDNSTVMFKGNKIYESSIGNGFILDYCYNSKNCVYSYGKLNQIERDDSKIIYLTPESYNGNPIIKGENEDNLGLVLGKYWKGIIYKTILYSKTISLLEINFLKNLMEKDEIIDINHPIFISNTEDEK